MSDPYDRCDYCGLPLPLVMLGKRRVNVPCRHDEVANREAEIEEYA